MTRRAWPGLGFVTCAALAACGQASTPAVLETVVASPVTLSVEAEGELQSAKSTPLAVPGENWAPRQLAWMLPDGSTVKKGEMIARFAAEQGKKQLAQAQIELQRTALARAGRQAELQSGQERVGVDMAKVATDLAIARRYASAELSIARNDVLDAVQDTRLLGTRRDALAWKNSQFAARGAAEQAVFEAQRATHASHARTSQADLQALELRAPHDGVFVLGTDWSGEKPTIGANLPAGMDLGSLPDTDSIEVELALPQQEAHGIKVGDDVEMHPIGRPDQLIVSKLSWVASSAKVMGRESPVKFLTMKAVVPREAVDRYGLVPGQQMKARVFLLRAKRALSVANIALQMDDGHSYVRVRTDDGFVRRRLTLGARGNARSEVLAGLQPGEEVMLTPQARTSAADPATDATDEAGDVAGADPDSHDGEAGGA